MSKPIIAMRLRPTDYAGLVSLGNRVIVGLTGNLLYATPLVPLATLETAVADVANAQAARGTVHSHGTTADMADLRNKALILHQLLQSEAQYVQATAQVVSAGDYSLMAAMITTSGYGLAMPRTPQGRLEMVQNLHRFISRTLAKNEVKLKWKKPLNVTSKTNVKEYKVLRASSLDFTTAVEVAIVTKATFIDVNSTVNTVKWTYWVIAYNTSGAGVPSDPVTVDVLGV